MSLSSPYDTTSGLLRSTRDSLVVDDVDARAKSTAERPPRSTGKPEPVAGLVAIVDIVVVRDDLGPGCHTLIAEGSTIPAGLADLPRYRRDEWPPPERKKRLI